MKICESCGRGFAEGLYCTECGGRLRDAEELSSGSRLKSSIGSAGKKTGAAAASGRIISSMGGASRVRTPRRSAGGAAEKRDRKSAVVIRKGKECFERAPRLSKELPRATVSIEAPPNIGRKPEINWLSTLVPVFSSIVLAVVMTLVMGSIRMLIFSVPMTIVGLFLSLMNYRKQTKKFESSQRELTEKYAEHLNEKVAELERYRAEQLEAMENTHCHTADCYPIAKDRLLGLWERSPEDADFAVTRIGSGNVDSSVAIKIPGSGLTLEENELRRRPREIYEQYSTVPGAPIVCDIRAAQVCGIVGRQTDVETLVQNMLVQLAVRHCYTDLNLILVCDEEQKERLRWIRELPHNKGKERKNSFVAATKEEAAKLYESFCDHLKFRKLSIAESGSYGGAPVFRPYYLFVFLRPEYLSKTDPIVEYLFKSEDLSLGVIMTAADRIRLPKECRTIIELDGDKGEIYSTSSTTRRTAFTMDRVEEGLYSHLSGALRPLVCNEELDRETIPEYFTFYDMYNVERAGEINIAALWAASDSVNSLSVPVGAMEKGKLLHMDIHEKAHGPHGLMAGASGYGKSELLQSYILSLALNFHPYELGVFVIDFKSGLPTEFDSLPHMLGVIRDIDGGGGDKALDRSLLSIKAEAERRKRLFSEVGVKDVLAYNRLYKRGELKEPCPQLVIIVDEFAELKQTKPEFIKELVSTARVGRSLGLHLILATQNISGQVDDQISANCNFRFCLRVNTAAQSKEMLGTPLASALAERGRAYLRIEDAETCELFQSAYGGAKDESEPGITQQTAVINHIKKHCAMCGIKRLAPLCLPMLPRSIGYIADFRRGSAEMCVTVGLCDAPERQMQTPLSFPISGANSLVIGSSLYGKSNLLQLVIRAAADKYSPDELNIYVIDCAGGFLKNFEGLPHVGGVAAASEEERMGNLFKLLNAEIARRKAKLLSVGVSSHASYREAGYRDLPQILLLVDNFTTLRELCLGDDDPLLPIVKDGLALGISVVLTNTQHAGIKHVYDVNIANRLAFYCNQSEEYSNLFGYTKLRSEAIPGRCLCKAEGGILEAQVFLAFEGEREIDRHASILGFVRETAERCGEVRAKPIPGVPDRLSLRDMYRGESAVDSGEAFALGMDYGTVEPVVLPFDSQFMLALMGKDSLRKKRCVSNLLTDLMENMASREARVWLVDSLKKEYAAYADMPFMERYSTDADSLMGIVEQLRDELSARALGGTDSDSMPLLLVIVNNARALEQLSASKAHMKLFEEIAKDYRDWKVMFLMADVDNKSVGYGSGDLLKKIKEERKALIFDSLKDVKFYDISMQEIRANKALMGEQDAYYLNGDLISRIKLAGGGKE